MKKRSPSDFTKNETVVSFNARAENGDKIKMVLLSADNSNARFHDFKCNHCGKVVDVWEALPIDEKSREAIKLKHKKQNHFRDLCRRNES